MKRWLVSLLCICMVFSLVSCGGRENGQASGSQDQIAESGQTNGASSENRQPVQGSKNTEHENSWNWQAEDGDLPDTADEDSFAAQEPSGEDGNVPVVYMTTEISVERLMAVPGPIRQCTIRWRRIMVIPTLRM